MIVLAWEMPPLVSLRNDVWETRPEIPFWRCVTTQIWEVLLIGWSKFPMQQDQSELLPGSSVWNCALMSQMSFGGKTSGVVVKYWLFSQAVIVSSLRAGGWGFSSGFHKYIFTPGYFHRKIEEKYNQKKSLAVWFPHLFARQLEILVTALLRLLFCVNKTASCSKGLAILFCNVPATCP